MMRSVLLTCLVGLLTLNFMGCASDTKSSALDPGRPDVVDATEPDTTTPDTSVPDVSDPDVSDPDVSEDVSEDVSDPDTAEDVVDPPSCVMFPSVGGDIFVAAGGALEVGVYVYESGSQQPLEGQDVSFEIVDGPEDVEFFNTEASSDEEGLAESTIIGGVTPGVARVRATSACGEPREFDVEVLEVPTGNMRLFFDYPSLRVYSLNSVEAELFITDAVECADLEPGENPEGQLLTGTTNSVAGSITFSDLTIDSPFTVVAYGIGDNGARAAWGCEDNISLVEDVTVDVTVTLDLLPLDFSGEYRVDSNWNFTDALNSAGPAGQIINQITAVFVDPGAAIYGLLFDLLDSLFGGLVSGGIEAILDIFGLDNTIQGLISSLIDGLRDGVDIFDTLFRVGETLANVINNLQVVQHWTVDQTVESAVSSSVVVDAAFVSIELFWLANPSDPDCNFQNPQNCDSFEIPIDRTGGDIGTLDTVFEGVVSSYNRLSILQHTYDFNYLAIVQAVLEQFLFPVLTDREPPVYLEDLVYELVGCEGIGNAIGGGNNDCLIGDGFVGDIVGCVCDESSTCQSNDCDRCLAVEDDVCIAGIDLVLGPVLGGLLDSFALESFVRASGGDAELVNLDADLQVEALVDGEFDASLNFGEGGSPRVPITFSGTRIGD